MGVIVISSLFKYNILMSVFTQLNASVYFTMLFPCVISWMLDIC